MRNVTARSVGHSRDGVGCEEGMKMMGMTGGLPFFFPLFSVTLWQFRSLAQLLLWALPWFSCTVCSCGEIQFTDLVENSGKKWSGS